MSIEGPNAEQAEYWSTLGRSWVEHEADQDMLLAPVSDALLELTGFQAGDRVLDIGCGTGAHALAVAEQVGLDGRVVALDVSEPFLQRTKERADLAGLPVETFHGDAQTAVFRAEFDVLTSRLGVMFFADPAAAFANMARALRPGGRMVFAAWAPVAVNPYWRLQTAVASARLGTPPPTPPHAPGPMGLADSAFVVGELTRAELAEASVTEHQINLWHEGGAKGFAARCVRIGSAARIIRLFDGTEADRAAIEAELTEVFTAYEDGDHFAVPATLNIIEARVS